MKHKVLFVMQGGGGLSQDFVRGRIYQGSLATYGVAASYIGYRVPPPAWATQSTSHILQVLASSIGFKFFWKIVDLIGTQVNHQRIVRMSQHYDAIVLVKVDSLKLVEQIRRNSNARLIYDMSDALWLPLFAAEYPDIRKILSIVDIVSWDYKYTLEFARQYNSNAFPWPAISQVELFDRNRGAPKPSSSDGKITLGWVGSFGTVFNLYEIWEALEHIFSVHPNLHLRLVGGGTNKWLLPHFERVSYSVLPVYSPQQMVEEVLKMDIGLFPLFDVEDSRVRGFLKALVYMSGEAAVIASPRGQVPDLIQDGINGMLATSKEEWIDKLNKLITNHEMRRQIAAAGLQTARQDYSLGKSTEALLHVLGMA